MIEFLERRALLAADLVVSELHTVPGTLLRSDGIRVFGSVKNIGTDTFPGTIDGTDVRTIRLFLSTAPNVGQGTDYGIGRLTLGDIAPGGTAVFDRFANVPAGAPAGTYYLTAMADPDNVVAEADETNNTRGTPNAQLVVSDSVIQVPDEAALVQSFGTGGVASATLAGQRFVTDSSMVDAQGRVLVAGGLIDTGQAILLRFLPNGVLDTSFGNGGLIVSDLLSGNFTKPVALTPEGKIILVGTQFVGDSGSGDTGNGTAVYRFGVSRYNEDGTLDTTFGEGGVVTTDVGSLAGASASGALNVTINAPTADGVATVATAAMKKVDTTPGMQDTMYSVVVDGQGRIYTSGRVRIGGDNDILVARYLPGGTLDPSFNGNGVASLDIGGEDEGGTSLALTPDGGVVAVGDSGDVATASGNIVVAKFTGDGALDKSFARNKVGGGVLLAGPKGPATTAHDVAVDDKGRIVVVGSYTTGTLDVDIAGPIAALRFTSKGTLDKSFGSKGETLVELPQFEQNTAKTVNLLADGQIVIGSAVGRTPSDVVNDRTGLAVTRLDLRGRIETGFGTNGTITVFLPPEPEAIAQPGVSAEDVVALDDTASDSFDRAGQGAIAVLPGGGVLAIAASVSDTDTQVTIQSLVPDAANLSVQIAAVKLQPLAGSSDRASLKVSNTGTLAAKGTVRFQVFAGDAVIGTASMNVSQNPGTSKVYRVDVMYPDALSGSVALSAMVDSPDGSVTDFSASNNVSLTQEVNVAARVVDLAVEILAVKGGVVATRVTNVGNATAMGDVTLKVYATSDDSVDPAMDLLIGSMDLTGLVIKAKKKVTAKVAIDAFSTAKVGVVLTAADAVGEAGGANNVAVKEV